MANRVVPTPDYVRFALHYRFRPDFCEAADPESKGIVENLVGYAKSDLPTMLLLDGVPDLVKGNEAARAWCVEVNAAVHSEIAAVPEQRLTQERPLLGALPSLQLRIGPPLLRNDLLIIDEVGFAPLDDTRTQLLFRLVAAAYERRSLAIASHWSFEDWGRFLPEHATAVSLLDRLLHHATTVVTSGSPTECAKPEPTEEDHGTRTDQPQGVGTFTWPPAGTSTWPWTLDVCSHVGAGVVAITLLTLTTHG